MTPNVFISICNLFADWIDLHMSDIEANLTVKLHVSDVILMMMNLKWILEQVEWTIRERMNWVNYAQLQQCEKAKQILDFSSKQILDFSPKKSLADSSDVCCLEDLKSLDQLFNITSASSLRQCRCLEVELQRFYIKSQELQSCKMSGISPIAFQQRFRLDALNFIDFT